MKTHNYDSAITTIQEDAVAIIEREEEKEENSPGNFKEMNSLLSSIHVLFRNAPTYVDIAQISSITDVMQLIRLEKEYDSFIENESDLQYYDHILEECLEIRDAIKIQIDKCIRIDLLRKHYYNTK